MASHLTREDKEFVLLNGKILELRDVGIGVTGSLRATLSDSQLTHDAHVQSVDIYMKTFHAGNKSEVGFRDYWGFNVAAYRLDKLLDLNMVPVSVKRRVRGKMSSVTWWVDGVMMTGSEFAQGGGKSPTTARMKDQMDQGRAFQQLVYNMDPNAGNFVIDEDWKAWMLDYSRAFRRWKKLEQPEQLKRIGRGFYQRLRDLDPAEIEREVGPYLKKVELKGLLARKELLIRHFEREIAERGEEAVLIEGPGF